MKQLSLLFVLVAAITACQIEDDQAPSPNESFIKYYGDLTGYVARDIEFLYDSSGFVVFGDVTADDGSTDYAILRMDLDGNLIDSVYFSLDLPLFGLDVDGDGQPDSLRGDDNAGKIVVTPDGYALVGTTLLNNNSFGVTNLSVGTFSFFDNQLTRDRDQTIPIFAIDNLDGEQLDQIGSDLLITRDGGILIMGSREMDRGGGVSDFDFYLIKIRLQQNGVGIDTVFEQTIGIPGNGQDDILVRGFEKADRNIVLIGHSFDVSDLGENGGDNGRNVTFMELNSAGQIINSNSYGFENPGDAVVFNETVSDAIQTPSGFAITGTTTLSTERSYAFFMNLNANGQFIAGDTLSSAFRLSGNPRTSIETNGIGIAQGRDSDYIILGQYPDFNFDMNINDPTIASESRAGEAMFMKVDQFGVPIAGLETFYGSQNGSDFAVDALTLPDGKIVVLANVDFGGGIQLVSLIKTNDSGNLVD